jgi:ATP-dependent HslUV protease ATP-binding subunit HslU
MQDSLKDMFNSLNSMQQQPITKEITIKEAKKILRNDVQEALSDLEHINQEAIKRVEDGGIIFLDEIDKIALSNSTRNDPGKEGVQRDLLPIIEGSTVNTKYGSVNTDHILFIGAGAFHVSRPSDLIPELQGRFPIRVELNSLTKDDLYKILTSTKNSLIQQSIALLKVEDIDLEFDDEAIKAMAKLAFVANEKTEDIGARRLHTVIERILEDISFNCEDYANQNVKITSEMIHKKLDDLIEDEDTARYIL